MDPIILSLIIVTSIGMIGGVILVATALVMHAPLDETTEQILEVLPGANCGSCGYDGCAEYASSIVDDEEETSLCVTGGPEAAKKIVAILGADGGEVFLLHAVVACGGDCSQTKKVMDFQGEVKTCLGAKNLYDGDGACRHGCLGYGDCVSHCAFHAITVTDGVAEINKELCSGCGSCQSYCPKDLISIRPVHERKPFVACSNPDKGTETVDICKVGCVACQKCVTVCPRKAISMNQCVAVIDQEKCIACQKCLKACPRNVIIVPS